MFRSLIAATAATLILATPQVMADTFELVGSTADSTEGLCDFTAVLDYTPAGDGLSGVLTVNLTNTTDAAIGGKITGFLFNYASSDADASITLLAGSSHPFKFASGKGQPFGSNYDAGAALGGNWQGGGNPNPGIAVGTTGTFSFLVVADDAGALSAADFASGPYEFNFVVRFRGLANGGSDKVPGIPGPPPPPSDCPCDLTGDGLVNELDLNLVLDAWEFCIANPDCSGPDIETADLNGDGTVNELDLKLFLLCWNACSFDA